MFDENRIRIVCERRNYLGLTSKLIGISSVLDEAAVTDVSVGRPRMTPWLKGSRSGKLAEGGSALSAVVLKHKSMTAGMMQCSMVLWVNTLFSSGSLSQVRSSSLHPVAMAQSEYGCRQPAH
jgi:hypothetical protein